MRSMLSILLRTFLCGLTLLVVASNASAQFKAGVQGTVTDTAGAIVPGATVTLTNNETSKIQTVTISDTSTPQLETENANVRGVITTEEVQRLPQVGRNPYELIRTAPGVLGDTSRGGP